MLSLSKKFNSYSKVWQLFLGAAIISFSPTLVKVVNSIGPSGVGAWRCAIGFLVLLPFVLYQHFVKKQLVSFNSSWFLLILAGFIFSMDLYVWNRSIYLAGSGIATILGNTQAIYLGLVGIFVAKEAISLRFLLAFPTAALGILLMSDVNTISALVTPEQKANYLQGILYGLMTGIFYAGYILSMRRLEKNQNKRHNMTLLQKMAFVTMFTALFMFAQAYLEGEQLLPSTQDFFYLFLSGAIAHDVGWIIITASLPFVPISRSGLILTAQPLLACVWGLLLFKESFELKQLLGIILTLIAIYLGISKTSKSGKANN